MKSGVGMNADTMPRHRDWLRRYRQGHGFAWGELWADVRSHPDYPIWQQIARQRGLAPDEESLGYHMTRGLILEVIHAAGGVERELAQVQAALEEAQAWTDQAALNFPREREKPLLGSYAAAPTLVDVSYTFVNLLMWARTVRERVERPWRPGSSKKVGLLPALEPGQLQNRVAQALSVLEDALAEARYLANYALHAGSLPSTSTPAAEVLEDGRVLFRIPDPVTGPITTWEEFSFDGERDALTYAHSLMQSAAAFVDEMLTAFEDNVPARVRT
jgi:hypothetical protein